METCEGIHDWLKCPECRHICTSQCPLEGSDVMSTLSRKFRKSDKKGKARTIFGDTAFEFSFDDNSKIN